MANKIGQIKLGEVTPCPVFRPKSKLISGSCGPSSCGIDCWCDTTLSVDRTHPYPRTLKRFTAGVL